LNGGALAVTAVSITRALAFVDALPLSTGRKFGVVRGTRTRTGAIGLPKRAITPERNFATL
jgi:hypothetical protein